MTLGTRCGGGLRGWSRALAGLAIVAIARAAAGASLAVTKVIGLQPGWVRVTVDYEAGGTPSFTLVPSCLAPTSADSVRTSTAKVLTAKRRVLLDLRVDLAWVAAHGLQNPCDVTTLAVTMLDGATELATTRADVSFRMDLPLSHLHPDQLTGPPAGTSLELAPPTSARRHAAYPPRLLAVKSTQSVIAFVEVEELSDRGSVGLRGVATFDTTAPPRLAFELAAGAEIFPDWGLDVDANGLGVTRETLGVEETHPGFRIFPYAGTTQPPILSDDTSLRILPAPPLFDDTIYLANVLDDRGVPRCRIAGGCVDLKYDQIGHRLRAVNGATLVDLDPGPIMLATPRILRTRIGETHLLAAATAMPGQALERRLVRKLLALRRPAGLRDVDLHAQTVLPSVTTPLDLGITRQGQQGAPVSSPQEVRIDARAGAPLPTVVVNRPEASCVINGTHTGVTAPVSPCAGFSAAGFRCPIAGDSLDPRSLPAPPGSATRIGILGTLGPYPAGRDNYLGTCGSHAVVQYFEALLNRYTDDLAPKRVIYVDGQPVTVPRPRPSFSVTSDIWQLYAWSGTRTGDPGLDCPGCPEECSDPCMIDRCDPNPACRCTNNVGRCIFESSSKIPRWPLFAEAYWPAREGGWLAWTTPLLDDPFAGVVAACGFRGFWQSAFCVGQGQPQPGVYRNYSRMVAARASGTSPLADPPWTLVDTYFNLTSGAIPLGATFAERDSAVQEVIAELQGGLPVLLSFSSGTDKTPSDGAGGTLGIFKSFTWYLAPELGACSGATLVDTFGRIGGHAVLLVGYAVQGSLADPDPFNSYFVIFNNWGKSGGDGPFFFINFAAFKYLANGLRTYRLDRTCRSAACATQPPGLPIADDALLRIEYPPDPARRARRRYDALMKRFLPALAGLATESGVPDVPGLGG